MKRLFYILVSCLFLACNPTIDTLDKAIHACAPHPAPVAGATSFVYNGEAYVFGGRLANGSLSNHLWRYNPQHDTWTNLGTTPLVGRTNGVAVVVNDTIYIGLGHTTGYIYADSCYLRDFWQFIPTTQTWQQLADYPISATDGCVAFHTDTALYVGCGFFAGFSAYIYTYIPHRNTWELLPPVNGKRPLPSMAVCGAQTAKGRYFVGTGYNLFSNSNWYEFFPATGNFITKTELPTKGRDCATATATDEYIYVIGGQHFGGTLTTLHAFDDILRYSPTNDSWTRCGQLPIGILKMTSFTINNRIYFGLGEDIEGNIQNTLYWLED